MFGNQNLYLKGVFSYSVFNESGELKETVTGIQNFITSTGLTYPSTYAFADCFRFISLGTGLTPNTLRGSFGGTTGLSSGIAQFSYIGSRSAFYDSSTSQYETLSCGYRESLDGVTLSRGWKIPSDGNTFDGDYSFSEISLSPGKPTGIARLCGCNGGDTSNGGVDASAIADYYDSLSNNRSICNANKAFTRIILDTPISVNNRDFLIVNYNLNITVDTGVSIFNNAISNTFSSNWRGRITGRSNIIHHGLKLINDGNLTSKSSFRNQISTNYTWANEYGESYIPLWGAPLEPSCESSNLLAYLSTDNVQFLVNQISGGGLDYNLWYPYNIIGLAPSSGLMQFVPNPSQITDPRYFNIRTSLTGPKFPAQTGVLSDGPAYSDINYILHSSSNKTRNILSYVASGRNRTMLYPFVFTNLNSFNWVNGISPTPLVRSMVLNYSDINAVNEGKMYPFLDLLFTGNLGEGLVPTGTVGFEYDNPSTNYYPLGGGGDLTLSFLLNWSSDCPSTVCGCPGSSC